MKFDKPKCPQCGAPPRGTIDRLQGCAELSDADEAGEFEYSGTTNVWWDGQRTIRDKKNRVLLMCEDAHEWFSKMEGD
jgi:hypothetical protein